MGSIDLKIALASDHGGYILKEEIKKHLEKLSVNYVDLGTNSEESVDYPIYAKKATDCIINGQADRAILCCGTGIGISIAANKVKGIRAAVCSSEFTAEMCRRHNDANALCLGARVLPADLAIKLVDIFLNTEFDGGRHSKRLEQISEIENS